MIKRRLARPVLVGMVLALMLTAVAGAVSGGRSRSCLQAVAGQRDLGRLAFIEGDQLKVLTLATCQVRTLVTIGASPPVRWSADGRYLAWGPGSVISASGGKPSLPLGRLQLGWGSASPGWAWSPTGHRLAGVTGWSNVVVGGPGERTVALLPHNWGARSIAWSPDGRTLAVSRSRYLTAPAPYHQEIWLLDLASGRRRLVWRLGRPHVATPYLSGFSPDGRWLLAWEDSLNSASLAADGVPLVAIPTARGKPVTIGDELMYGDFVSWCGRSALAYVIDHGGREVSMGDAIGVTGAPTWSTTVLDDWGVERHLSYISPVCDSLGGERMTVAAAGRSSSGLPTGHERRSIFEVSPGGNWTRMEDPPPPGWSDEQPMVSSDGRWIAFIRTDEAASSTSGRLYLLDLGQRFDGRARLVGPLADLPGAAAQYGNNYYGHYDWADQVAWYSR